MIGEMIWHVNEDEKPYVKVYRSSEFNTFQEAVEHVVKVSEQLHKDNYGMVVLISDYKDITKLPTHKESYIADGVTYNDWCLECEVAKEVEIVRTVTHVVEWTKPLKLEDNFRVSFQCIENCTLGQEEKFIEYMEQQCDNVPVGFTYQLNYK